eukprot:GHVT01076076.1.p2 GENE.GHVT01076076.1~~GHVT01076076.1.p2  ORF type:complete len:101 (-),score=7.46 GHVT01076076.1:949-1251(-)
MTIRNCCFGYEVVADNGPLSIGLKRSGFAFSIFIFSFVLLLHVCAGLTLSVGVPASFLVGAYSTWLGQRCYERSLFLVHLSSSFLATLWDAFFKYAIWPE